MPTLDGHEELVPVDTNGRLTAPSSCSAMMPSASPSPRPGSRIVKSSALMRATVSASRTALGEAPADALQQLVADAWPRLALTFWKPSRSTMSTASFSRSRASSLDGLVHAVFEEQLVGEAGEAVVRGLVADLAHEVSVLEGGRTDGPDRLEQLHVVGVEPGDALAAADHEPLLVVVAQGQLTPRSSCAGRWCRPTRPEHAAAPSAEWAKERVTASVSIEEWTSSAVRKRRSSRSRSSRARKCSSRTTCTRMSGTSARSRAPGIRRGARAGEHHRSIPRSPIAESGGRARRAGSRGTELPHSAEMTRLTASLADHCHRERSDDRCDDGSDRDLARVRRCR